MAGRNGITGRAASAVALAVVVIIATVRLTGMAAPSARAQGTLPLAAPPSPTSSLYAVNFGNSTIEEYAYSSGSLSSMGTTFDNRATDMKDPNALAFDRAGNLYVANFFGNTISKYANAHGSLSRTGTQFADAASGVNSPSALAFDRTGNLYVANKGVANNFGGTIEKYAFSSGTLSRTGTQFTSSGLNNPDSLAFDNAGDLYAANYGSGGSSGTIEKYTYTNGSLSRTGTLFASGLGQPYALAFDSAGNLYVINDSGGDNTIEEFAYNKGSLRSAGILFTANGLKAPYGLAFGPASAP